jgi:dihydroorotate dehydrogenase
MEQINSAFVSTKKITIEDDDGQPKIITILVLDEEANNEYWKVYNSFGDKIAELNLSSPEDAIAWVLSEPFLKSNSAVRDIMTEVMIKDGEEVMVIHGIPVTLESSEDKICKLILKNETVHIHSVT